MTDIDPLDARGRSAAASLLADVPESPPALVEAQRRSRRRTARRTAVSAGLLVIIGLGVAVPLYVDRSARSDLQGPRAAEALDGPWRLPAPSERVEVEVLVTPTATARPRPRPSVQARTVAGPWRARISGRRLVLRNPATNAIVVQHINFFSPGHFSVQEPPAETSASGFGCTADGQYSWALEGGTLDVDAIDDPCVARAAVLEAGTWTNIPFVENGPTTTPSETTEPPTSPDAEVTPEPTTSVPPSEEPSPSPAP
jgi:hypothetical protein